MTRACTVAINRIRSALGNWRATFGVVALLAVAAIAMHAAVSKYNKNRKDKGFQPIGIGVGLHIGDLMLGIIGHEQRMQGTVVADAVNQHRGWRA